MLISPWMCANSPPNLNPCLPRKYERLSEKLNTGLENSTGRPRQLPRIPEPKVGVMSTLGKPPVVVIPVLRGKSLPLAKRLASSGTRPKCTLVKPKRKPFNTRGVAVQIQFELTVYVRIGSPFCQ